MPVYRGGPKFSRALASLRECERYFRRIVVSLNAPPDSNDLRTLAEFRAAGGTRVEVVQTGIELPWMDHQYFWLKYLEGSGETGDSWVTWVAHDDQLRAQGLSAITDQHGSWRLSRDTIYLGPWGMRYDPLNSMYDGPADKDVESWTSFPLAGPLRMKVGEWIAQQLEQPTYINMSGCVARMASFQALRSFPITKPGGMRIEMATAAAPDNVFVQEFPEPIVITYTSKGSDRTKYEAIARRDDRHFALWLANYLLHHPSATIPTSRAASRVIASHIKSLVGRGDLPSEEWRYRTTVEV